MTTKTAFNAKITNGLKQLTLTAYGLIFRRVGGGGGEHIFRGSGVLSEFYGMLTLLSSMYNKIPQSIIFMVSFSWQGMNG